MAGGVHVTALPPTGLDADVRMLASYHWCGVRRVLLQDNRGATVETGGPGRSIDLGSAPTRHLGAGPCGLPRSLPNSLAKRGTFRMEVVGTGDCRSAAGVVSTDLTPLPCFPAAKFERRPQRG